jgi:hypothetical protein
VWGSLDKSNGAGYSEIFTKIALHEIGHTMGLNELQFQRKSMVVYLRISHAEKQYGLKLVLVRLD